MNAIVGLHFLAAGYMQFSSVAFTSLPRKVVHGRFGTINLYLICRSGIIKADVFVKERYSWWQIKILLSFIKAHPQSTVLQHQCDIMAEHHIWAALSQASLSASAPSSSFQRWLYF